MTTIIREGSMSDADATLSPLTEQLFEGISDTTIQDAMGWREPGAEAEAEAEVRTESTLAPVDPGSAISKAAYEFVVRWETGGKAYYEQVIRGRPIWPGYSSGITIGCGFDLGYQSLEYFKDQWQTWLSAADFQRLAGTIGFRTTPPNRDAKVVKARQLVTSLSDIVVPWATAIEQFDNAKLPKLVGQLYAALDNLDRLHPHSRGALLSLVFNRGASFKADGDRYREMRRIRALMSAGTEQDFAQIPAELRSMKRIWGAQSSLSERREGEAKLFEAGLHESALLESVASLGPELEAASIAGGATENLQDLDVEQTDIADDAEDEGVLEQFGLEAAGLSAGNVKWNPSDMEQPDYGHLDGLSAGGSFEVLPQDIEALIGGNEFQPLAGRVVLALRGAGLPDGDQEDADSFELVDQRPDHRTFRCVIGAFDRQTKRFWVYRASTVPNARYVFNCYRQAQQGVSIANLLGNILPTGCYTFTVGTHKKNKPGEIPGVLRLSTTASGASQVVVQRSLSDVVYDRKDLFPTAGPADNIHPSILNTGFSSAGCLTVPGKFTGQHTGSWKKFRSASEIQGAPDGTQRSCILLTGLDVIAAVRARTGVGDPSGLRRLRHGSRGDRVKALQTALGLQPDAAGIMGPVTRKALYDHQAVALGWADGIYSPAMDGLLGFNVYATV